MTGDDQIELELADVEARLDEQATTVLVDAVVPLLTGGPVLVLGTHLPQVAAAVAGAGHEVVVVARSDAEAATVTPEPGVTARAGDPASLSVPDGTFAAAVVVDPPSSAHAARARELDRVVAPRGRIFVWSGERPADTGFASRSHVISVRQVDLAGSALVSGDGQILVDVEPGDAERSRERWLTIAANDEVEVPVQVARVEAGLLGSLLGTVQELLAERAEDRRRLAAVQAQLDALHGLQERLVEAEQLAGTARSLELELAESRQRNETLLVVLDTIYRSSSWRVTEPMRRAGGALRGAALDTARRLRAR